MKRIGIFLGYPPEVSLRKEGISRLLGFIMKAAIADDRVKLVIACPKWLEGNVRALLEDHHIDGRHVELMTTRAVPALIRMSLFVRKFVERSKSQKLKLRRRLAPFVKRVLYNLRQTMTGGSWGKKQPREGKLLAVLFGWMATSSILVFLASVFVAAG
ncbi:hypothetical protein GC177_09865, partial [bacterium]|nr:hypothetical protein [bacterium]